MYSIQSCNDKRMDLEMAKGFGGGRSGGCYLAVASVKPLPGARNYESVITRLNCAAHDSSELLWAQADDISDESQARKR